jgi:hypothetical protein
MAMSREKALTEAFVEAADTLVDDFDVIDFLHRRNAASNSSAWTRLA